MSEVKLKGYAHKVIVWTMSALLATVLVCAPKTQALASDLNDEAPTSESASKEQSTATDAEPVAQETKDKEAISSLANGALASADAGEAEISEGAQDDAERETQAEAEAEQTLESKDAPEEEAPVSEAPAENVPAGGWSCVQSKCDYGTRKAYEALEPIPYIGKEEESALCTDYVVLSGGSEGPVLVDGAWYVVKEDTSFESRMRVAGSANLIICDGVTLTANNGVELTEGNSLAIYAQSEGDEMGSLVATCTSEFQAGIGGSSENGCAGELTVYGCSIRAVGNYGAGIGGGGTSEPGGACNGATVTVWRGKVDATGSHAAGIGGGYSIVGVANGTSLQVQSGTVLAKGDTGCAGIGGGVNGAGGVANIAGEAAVTSIGGANAPGIGGGCNGADAVVSIDSDARVALRDGDNVQTEVFSQAAGSERDAADAVALSAQSKSDDIFDGTDKSDSASSSVSSSPKERAKEGRLNISKASVALATKTFVYDGTSKRPAVTVTMNGRILEPNVDYLIVYARNVNAGKGKVTVLGKGRYEGRQVTEFRIAPVCFSVQAIEDQVYSGKSVLAMPTVTSGSKKLALGRDYTLQWKNNMRVGTATVIVKGKGNYVGSKSVSFKIVEGDAESSSISLGR